MFTDNHSFVDRGSWPYIQLTFIFDLFKRISSCNSLANNLNECSFVVLLDITSEFIVFEILGTELCSSFRLSCQLISISKQASSWDFQSEQLSTVILFLNVEQDTFSIPKLIYYACYVL